MGATLRKKHNPGAILSVLAGILLIWLATLRLTAGQGVALNWAALIFGALLVLIFGLRLAARWGQDTRKYVVVNTDTGSVRLHAAVVEEELRRTARSLPDVHDVDVCLIINPDTHIPMEGQVEARVRDLSNVVSIHDRLARVLRDRYEKILPGAEPIDFHLTIRRHEKDKRKPETKDSPNQEDETRSFRAPRYPVPH